MANNTTTWLVTGSSRGIGFEVVKQLASDPSREIFATCRNPETASALNSLSGKLHVVKLDVDDEVSIRNAAETISAILGDRGLDYLINNAGIVSPFRLCALPIPHSYSSRIQSGTIHLASSSPTYKQPSPQTSQVPSSYPNLLCP